jgi:hypothetical protein
MKHRVLASKETRNLLLTELLVDLKMHFVQFSPLFKSCVNLGTSRNPAHQVMNSFTIAATVQRSNQRLPAVAILTIQLI